MGFWGALAGIATSFIPGVGPLLAPLVGGAVNSLTSSGNTAGNTGTNQTAMQSVQLGPANTSPNVAAGASGINSAKNYFTSALNGDQTTMQELLGPEISTVLGQYDNAAKTAANLGPRGGGRTQTLAEAPFQKAAAYGKALAGAQTGAASQLGQLGEAQSSIGLQDQAQKNALNIAQGNLNLGQNRVQQEGYQFNAKQNQALGAGLGGILTNVLTGQKTNNGGGQANGGQNGAGSTSDAVTTPGLTVDQQYAMGF